MISDKIAHKVNAADFGFLPGNSGTDNAAAMSRAVESGANIIVDKSGVYDIAGSVRLPSDTHIIFKDGVILRRTPLEDKSLEGNLFVNEGAFEGRFNENISIKGAHIRVNGVESASASPESKNVIAGLRGHIAFLYIKNLLLEDIEITDLMEKDYGIQISDFENAEVRRVHIEGLKDGVHFGPGKKFAVRDSVFRTYDDAIALNCADYSVSNPNFGSISDGIIENCRELEGYTTYAFFIRILAGTARRWQKGMTVYHSDAIITEKGMYRVVMQPDNMAYVSETEPAFDDGYKVLDGIQWVRTHKAYSTDDIPLTAGCRNILCRNITIEPQRRRGVYIYTSFDEYLRSYYAGSEIPEVSDITFDNIHLVRPAEHFLAVNTKTENVRIINSDIDESDILYEENKQML